MQVDIRREMVLKQRAMPMRERIDQIFYAKQFRANDLYQIALTLADKLAVAESGCERMANERDEAVEALTEIATDELGQDNDFAVETAAAIAKIKGDR